MDYLPRICMGILFLCPPFILKRSLDASSQLSLTIEHNLTRGERDLVGETPRLLKSNVRLCFMIGISRSIARNTLYKPVVRSSPTTPYALRLNCPLHTTLAGQGFSGVSCLTNCFTAELSSEETIKERLLLFWNWNIKQGQINFVFIRPLF